MTDPTTGAAGWLASKLAPPLFGLVGAVMIGEGEATLAIDATVASAEQVREIGRRFFAPETQSIVVVGDKTAIADQLKPFGEFVAPGPR